ncbi:PqqD family protein [Desulfobacter curvatus]|uniref:PqqD family protein n=1 Tax=Desulfobacter curvatus TaxID=2290 RepID=UPI0003A19751|nr:PqqD family protein [Desulfobacter curvatus]
MTADNHLNRRDFLISLGQGAAVCIGGFFLINHWPDCPPALSNPIINASLPKLRKDIVSGSYQDMATIGYTTGDDEVLCAVNVIGRTILNKLDGQHTIEGIAEAVAVEFNIPEYEPLNAKIAYFVAQLGMIGFLCDPFYATIYFESETTHA